MCISDIGTIELEGMQFFAFHGVLPEEREEGNLFIVDFKGKYDISASMDSDELADTLDYGKIHHIVASEMEIPSKLLEHVAGRIARRIEREFPDIISFSISVAKQNPPVEGRAEWSRVTVSGGREE
jgi:dihydroneopterin aldolase